MLNTEYPARFERLAADFTTLAGRTADRTGRTLVCAVYTGDI